MIYLSSNSLVSFEINIDDLIRQAYDPLVQEFFAYYEFRDEILYNIAVRSSETVVKYMTYGLRYLRISSKNNFVDICLECDLPANSSLTVFREYAFENSRLKFEAKLAYYLLSETDIENYLYMRNFGIYEIVPGFITFTYREDDNVL